MALVGLKWPAERSCSAVAVLSARNTPIDRGVTLGTPAATAAAAAAAGGAVGADPDPAVSSDPCACARMA